MAYCYKNRKGNLATRNNYMLAKTLSMFEWENLPETIPYKEIERLLQVSGYAFVTQVNNKLYAFNGGLGGVKDVYGRPTQITISNTALNFNATLDVAKDGVLIFNDDMSMGLIPLFDHYNTFLIENDINMMMYGYNTRTQKLISASDDKTKQSAQLAIKRSIDGEIEVIGESVIFDGMKVHTGANNSSVSITSLTEFQQYMKGSLYNEIGLSANFNMKRERLTSSEVEQGDDGLFPLVFNMLKCRMKGVEKLNSKYDLQLNVDFGSVWSKGSKEVIDDAIKPNSETSVKTGSNSNSENPSRNNSEEQKAELMEILNSPESSEDDKNSAKELLDEMEVKNVWH